MRLSEHFVLEELTKSLIAERYDIDNDPGEVEFQNLIFLCESIQEPIRIHFDVPFSPNSGYRSEELNKIVGSSSDSQHTKGQAVDIEVPGVSNVSLAWWIRSHLDYDQLILEFYQRSIGNAGWIHVSTCSKVDVVSNRHDTLTYDGTAYSGGLPG